MLKVYDIAAVEVIIKDSSVYVYVLYIHFYTNVSFLMRV